MKSFQVKQIFPDANQEIIINFLRAQGLIGRAVELPTCFWKVSLVSGLQESYKAAVGIRALFWVWFVWVASTALHIRSCLVSQCSAGQDKDWQGLLIQMFWKSALKYYCD